MDESVQNSLRKSLAPTGSIEPKSIKPKGIRGAMESFGKFLTGEEEVDPDLDRYVSNDGQLLPKGRSR